MTSSSTDWRGEWLSLRDLATLLNKSYENVKKMRQRGDLDISGVRVHCISRRIRIQVDRSTLDSLRVPRD